MTRKGNEYWLVTSTFGYFPGVPTGLKIVSHGDTYDFLYRPAGSDEWLLLAADIPAQHVATQRGGFTGTTIGMAATDILF